jgi:hypothetical protein
MASPLNKKQREVAIIKFLMVSAFILLFLLYHYFISAEAYWEVAVK